MHRVIMREMLAGRSAPQERHPAIRALANHLGYSRAYAKAMSILMRVTTQHQRALALVNPRQAHLPAKVVRWLLQTSRNLDMLLLGTTLLAQKLKSVPLTNRRKWWRAAGITPLRVMQAGAIVARKRAELKDAQRVAGRRGTGYSGPGRSATPPELRRR